MCCAYCCNKSFDEPESNIEFEHVPARPEYLLEELNAFLAKDKDKNVSIIFYGGEPLLNVPFIEQVMDGINRKKVKNFLIQTNGVLLTQLPTKYANRFHTILVSIDGPKSTTDKNRGEGTYEKVVTNLTRLKKNEFDGEVIARMAVEEPTDFFDDVMFLLGANKKEQNKDFVFTSVHWQLDANMWHDYEKRDFAQWSKKYNAGVTKLADFWLAEMKKGRMLRLYPFLGIMNSLLFGTQYHLRCGSGVGNFTILPNGKISACPIMSGVKENYLGDIKTTNPSTLPFRLKIGEPCVSCKDFELCGGRCLYSNLHPVWPKKGVDEVCATIRRLIKEMERIAPAVQKLIDSGKIKKKDLEFLKYNCAEIIP